MVDEGSIDIDDVLSIGIARPFAVSLADLYLQGHGQGPDEAQFRIYADYDLWLIVHAIGAIRRAGNIRLRRLGYIVELGDPLDRHSGLATCGMAPETLVKKGPSLDATLGVEGTLELAGDAANWLGQIVSLVPGLDLSLSTDAHLTGTLRFEVKAQVTTATGYGRPLAEWSFGDADGPLFGDHVMVQTIRVPRGHGPVKLSSQVYAQVADWFEYTSSPRLVWSARLSSEIRPPAARRRSRAADKA